MCVHLYKTQKARNLCYQELITVSDRQKAHSTVTVSFVGLSHLTSHHLCGGSDWTQYITLFDKYLCYLFSFGIVRFRLAPYPISVPTTTVIRPVPFFRIPCAPYQSNPAAKIADFWMHTTCRFNKSVHNVLNQTKLDDRCIDHRRDRGIFVDQ